MLKAKLPGGEWESHGKGQFFIVPKGVKFEVEAVGDVAYLCYYKRSGKNISPDLRMKMIFVRRVFILPARTSPSATVAVFARTKTVENSLSTFAFGGDNQ